MTLRIYGVPKEEARCSVDTICKMKHFIRTIFGDSKQYYGGKKWTENGGSYPHGNGQGNRNGPSLWSCISSPLLNLLRAESFGIAFESPISHDIMDLSAIGFVDDMDYIQTEPRYSNLSMHEIQLVAQKGMDYGRDCYARLEEHLKLAKRRQITWVLTLSQRMEYYVWPMLHLTRHWKHGTHTAYAGN